MIFTPSTTPARRHAGSCLLLIGALVCAGAATADDARPVALPKGRIDELSRKLDSMEAEIKDLAQQNRLILERELKAEQRVQELESQIARSSTAPAATQAGAVGPTAGSLASNPVPPSGNPIPPGSGEPAPPGGLSSGVALFGGLKLWGYGELYYTRPTHVAKDTQADLARAVFGIGYTFDNRTEFNSEFEVEHAVASATDPGEFEVEQLYIDRQLADAVGLRAGLFLMPFGFLNEHHEPTNFYGVQRNFVETLIIPSTWREGGLNLHGESGFGLGWNVGLTTGFDLSKWDFAPQFPLYATALDLEDSDSAPLQASHQELALANAEHLSQYVALNYYGLPGFTIGGAINTGDAVKVPAPPNAPIHGNQRVTLWEGHARWTPGKFDLSALYAHGSISNLAIANASNPDSPNPIPSDFYGYYVQSAYTLWERNEYRLVPFVRWERYDLGSRYAGTTGPVVPTGLVPISANPGDYGYWPSNRDHVTTVGANFYTTPHVVWKLDYQWFDLNSDFTRFDLGVGLAF